MFNEFVNRCGDAKKAFALFEDCSVYGEINFIAMNEVKKELLEELFAIKK